MENAIELKNVSKNYKQFSLDNISFSVKKGFVTGFIGPNGAGKTSTIKMIMNLIHADSGSIELFGLDHKLNERFVKERIGFVYAENHFYDHLTIDKMKKIISPFYKNWDDALFYETVRKFDLPLKRKIKQLSTGMKMKFSLAIALAHHADLIIMDEPTSGLDPVFRSEVLDLFSEIMQDEEKTIFFSSHITSDLEQIADYITFIYDGRILFQETKDDILERFAIVKGDRQLLDADTRKHLIGIRETDFGFEALTADRVETREIFGKEVLIEQTNLEQLMVFTVRGEKHKRISS
ncbi:phenol-soluble modulin export ABC transporter ATP-binding protein PmtA [Desmospora activa]|uniref:ABC-2 type transport system ATP-binding protein n=1 Tax=Desmospora activa DSM 45169 TaxID=1121389 RepID=A0A2T4Z0F1_9BACL|nr:ABC transporter ATP-binding protein [Desmospora activa]PTM53224.1 ABC-2 type transport system ATP-binding protein [Desmospora activa DSM 45169]